MKILLLTSCPPCREYTGGQYLDRFVRFIDQDSIVCFAVRNERLHVEMRLSDDLDHIPIEYAARPIESGDWSASDFEASRPEMEAQVAAAEFLRAAIEVPRLVDQAVAFGQRHSVDLVIAVLEGQTLTRMALPVAEGLGVPLCSLVWDPLGWWLRDHRVDSDTADVVSRQFDETLRRSRSCAVASWAMAEEYSARYDVPSYAMPVGLPTSLAQEPKLAVGSERELVIGIAGQFYAAAEWRSVVSALDASGWRVADRDVRIIIFGRNEPPHTDNRPQIDFRGWHSSEETIRLLSDEADVLYCPYPFNEEMAEVSRLSFPSKLTTYFAAGRPVVFHGPMYSSPARYLVQHQAALIAASLNENDVVDHLTSYITQPTLYATMARRSNERFHDDFSDAVMSDRVHSYLQHARSDHGQQTPNNPAGRLDSLRPRMSVEQAYAGAFAILQRGLTLARQRNDTLLERALEAEARCDRLATRLARAADQQLVAEQVRDHYGRHMLALEELLDQARQRELAVGRKRSEPE